MTPFIRHKAEIWAEGDDYHWEVAVDDDFLYIKYKEENRIPQDCDSFQIPAELAESLCKTVVQLLKMKGE